MNRSLLILIIATIVFIYTMLWYSIVLAFMAVGGAFAANGTFCIAHHRLCCPV